jgi:hypothetical protein
LTNKKEFKGHLDRFPAVLSKNEKWCGGLIVESNEESLDLWYVPAKSVDGEPKTVY